MYSSVLSGAYRDQSLQWDITGGLPEQAPEYGLTSNPFSWSWGPSQPHLPDLHYVSHDLAMLEYSIPFTFLIEKMT